ncbi:hypothetical protein [Neptuniibacter halophilus]|uniref:hypothetical protein n=1 Tax=Neptuniibacter halophilus TaxID=651666 RepID=UPI0025741437|nr:hypothetical protein [Neptuniibacter halophilus]
MPLNSAYTRFVRSQQGLGLVSAIFVITVLALIIVGMARFFGLSQNATSQDFLAARALAAAQTGVELELACLEASETGCSASAAVGSLPTALDYWPGPTAAEQFNLAGLRGCRAEVYYRTVSADTGNFWSIESVGYCGGAGLDGASRGIVIRAEQ